MAWFYIMLFKVSKQHSHLMQTGGGEADVAPLYGLQLFDQKFVERVYRIYK